MFKLKCNVQRTLHRRRSLLVGCLQSLWKNGNSLSTRMNLEMLALRMVGRAAFRLSHKVSCGTNFTVDHVLSSLKGWFPSIRHNEMCETRTMVRLSLFLDHSSSDAKLLTRTLTWLQSP